MMPFSTSQEVFQTGEGEAGVEEEKEDKVIIVNRLDQDFMQ